jgi:hypothetical protein
MIIGPQIAGSNKLPCIIGGSFISIVIYKNKGRDEE